MTIDEYEKKFEKVYLANRPSVSKYIEGMLLFNEDTAHVWAGPFEGNYAYYRIQDMSKIWKPLISEAEQALKNRFSKYNFKFGKYGEDAQNEEHLQKRLATLTQSELNNWEWRQKQNNEPTATKENPIRFYMAGNDDCSYSKFYPTIEAAKSDLSLMKMAQPLDFYKDVKALGFHFSN